MRPSSLPVLLFGLFCVTQVAAQSVDPLDSLMRPQMFEARRESSANPDLNKNGDARPIPPGDTLILGDLTGPGVVTHLWCTIGSADPFHGRSLVLRIYWDGNEHPSVEAPLGDFFGVGHGAMEDFESLPVSTSSYGRSRNCYWKMPFRKSARITVTNDSPEYKVDSFYYYLDWQKHESLPDDIAYFHAQYRQAHPAPPGDYKILETEGSGHYVGTVQSVQQVEIGWFGEGDDRFYIDGAEEPQLRGTGTEDYYNDAWGFRKFDRPQYGVSLWEGYFPGDRVTAYRWHLSDPIPFKKSLKVTIEHHGSIFNKMGMLLGQFIERPDWVSSVAFWYQSPARGFSDPIAPQSKRIAPWKIYKLEELEVVAIPRVIVTKDKSGLTYIPRKPDAKIDIKFEIKEKGCYRIGAYMMHGLMCSRYQPLLNGVELGPELDLNQTGMDPVFIDFDLHDLDVGTHQISFVGRGASSSARTMAPEVYYLGIGNLMFLRMEDLSGYREALNAELIRR